jgi:hypothetical protein
MFNYVVKDCHEGRRDSAVGIATGLGVGGPRGQSSNHSGSKVSLVFTPLPLYLRGNSPRHPLDSRLGGTQSRPSR